MNEAPDFKVVKFRVIKDIYWDNWGRIVKVFRVGDVQTGRLYPDGHISAESTIYDGVSDGVDRECIEIIE